jgi:cytochrome d ubiquinol oxidase subunit II
MAALASLAALVSGDTQARAVYCHQPAKLAVFEAHFETGRGDLTLFGVPDEQAGRVRHAVASPGGLSFLLFGDFQAPVVGLDRFRPEDRPPLLLPFVAWRVMVGLGCFFLAVTELACFYQWRGTLFRRRWLLWVFVFAVLPAVVANQAGWAAAEVGRQPWIVQPPVPRDASGALARGDDGLVQYEEGLGLRASDSVSPVLAAGQVQGSMATFGLIYALLFALWITSLNDEIREGPARAEPGGARSGGRGFLAAAARRPAHERSLTQIRAVSIEFRSRRESPAWPAAWDVGFSAGSLLAALLFGVAVGNLMRGVPLTAAGEYHGSPAGQLDSYSLLVGALSVSLFAMHGTIYLHLKTEGELQRRVHRWMWRSFGIFLVIFMLIAIHTLVSVPRATAQLERFPVLWIIPVLNVLAIANIPRAIFNERPGRAFLSSVCTVVGLVFLLGAALFPSPAPSDPSPEHSLTLWNSASSPTTHRIMLLIAILGMSAVLFYTTLVYWTFHGKVQMDEHSY